MNEVRLLLRRVAPERRWERGPLGWAAIAGAVLLVYSPVFRAGLIWNDPDYVKKPGLRSVHGLLRIWTELGATEQYYPVLHSAFWLQHRLWGDAPLGYHLANLALHVVAAGLFGAVLRRLKVPGAFFGALLFAVHPVCVESVAWISEEKNTLALALCLASALTYLRFDAERKSTWYLLASTLFLAALLSKSVSATLPGALLVIAWWRRGKIEWVRDVVPLMPWFAVGAAIGLFTGWVERTYVGARGAPFSLSGLQRILLAGRAVWFYLAKVFWPAHLNFIYPRWTIDAAHPGIYLFAAGAALFAIALWLLRKRSRAPLAAYLIFVGSLFPTLGFFNVYAFLFSYVADHWQYEAMLGILSLVAGLWGLWAETPGRSRAIAPAAAAALLCTLGILTWRQSRMYRDVGTLYRTILERNPDAWLAHNNLGSLLMAAGQPEQAELQFREAMRTVPQDYPELHGNLGDAVLRQGRLGEAIAEYQTAVRLNAGYLAAQRNLANALLAAGRPGEALEPFIAALRLQPNDPECELDCGLAFLEAGRPLEAAAHDEAALRLRPDFPEARLNLGNVFAAAGQWDNAIENYEAALRIRPDYREARANLTQARYRLAELHANRGLALADGGKKGEAAAEYREALRILPDDPAARRQVEEALKELGSR